MPSETILRYGQTTRIVVSGALDAGTSGTVRLSFAYPPTVIRIRQVVGDASYALKCPNVRIVSNTVTDRTTATLVVECDNVAEASTGLLCAIDVEGLAGPDTIGTLNPLELVVNGQVQGDAALTSGTVRVQGGPGGGTVPLVEGILGNYPNPFRDMTRIEYAMEGPGLAHFTVRDMSGRMFVKLDPIQSDAGLQSFELRPEAWELSSGAYLLQMTTDRGTYFHSFMIMK